MNNFKYIQDSEYFLERIKLFLGEERGEVVFADEKTLTIKLAIRPSVGTLKAWGAGRKHRTGVGRSTLPNLKRSWRDSTARSRRSWITWA